MDIGFALMNVHQLDNQENQAKFVKKVEGFIVMTHETFFKGKNMNGIMSIMVAFDGMQAGTTEFWKRMEKLLEKALKGKREALAKEQCLQLLEVFARKNIQNEDIFEAIMKDC